MKSTKRTSSGSSSWSQKKKSAPARAVVRPKKSVKPKSSKNAESVVSSMKSLLPMRKKRQKAA